MKLLTLLICAILTSTLTSQAQRPYPVAVSSSGILLGKYKIQDDARNPLPDTISVQQAKEIFALDVVFITRDQKLIKFNVRDFQMTLFSESDSISVKNNTGILSPEAKNHLNDIKSGTRLIFEWIKASAPGEESFMSIIILVFTVM